ncbi:hypothetical protein SAMN06265368_0565 [Cohaesibacter gelatinilyticus]|uniref:Uncharacterized protein n=1 Tax=Cohaesibacter gelatinilyticus TaxID=372072 RepID=A0A285NBR9_9HYPH|nr:hypothetical protein SAMN06265368_0565 [Cohaesibacter gelatinilyticus]
MESGIDQQSSHEQYRVMGWDPVLLTQKLDWSET